MVFPNVNILPFDRQSGRVFGILKAELEKLGIGPSRRGDVVKVVYQSFGVRCQVSGLRRDVAASSAQAGVRIWCLLI